METTTCKPINTISLILWTPNKAPLMFANPIAFARLRLLTSVDGINHCGAIGTGDPVLSS